MNRTACDALFENYVDHFVSCMYSGDSVYPAFCGLCFGILENPIYSAHDKIRRIEILRDALSDALYF